MTDPEQGTKQAQLDAAEDALDLSDMEHGIDGALAGLERDIPDEAEEAALLHGGGRRRIRTRRSPALAVVVTLIGLYLLSTMWADFRYWTRGDDDLRDLGRVADIYADGVFVEDFDNQYVVVEATPDVQHAARMTTERGAFGVLRLQEAGGSLFASVPREDERPHDRFRGSFQGRIRELSESWNYEVVEQFFNDEQIIHTVDIEPAELARALRDQDPSLRVKGEEREISLGDADSIRLVVRQPDAIVQMGKNTWKRVADAEDALAELGFPFVRLDREGAHFHSFLVRVAPDQHDSVVARLDAGHEVPPNNPDPKVGAMVLARTATYVVAPEDVGVAGDAQLVFEYGENTTSPGYRVEGDRLVEKELRDGRLAVDLDALDAVRVERRIRVDPAGYVILVEDAPSKHWLDGVLFLLVLGLVGVNVASLVITLRRIRA